MNRSTLIVAAVAAVLSGAIAPVAVAAPEPATASLRQRASIDWSKGRHVGRDRVAFAIPGIGRGELVCRPNAAYLRVTPLDRTLETSMWSVLMQDKTPVFSYAVKNARIYRFGTPTTPEPASGSGPSAQEGLNVEQPMDDAAQGAAYGLISQRTAFVHPARPTAPLTSILLDWRWSGFRGPRSGQRCRATARFVTKQPAGTVIRTKARRGLFQRQGPSTSDLMLGWHGEQDASGKTAATPVELPGLGTMGASCPTGRDSDAALIFTASSPARPLILSLATWQGEGPDITEITTVFTDPLTGMARVPLPTNGFLYLVVNGVGTTSYAKIPVSSWRQTVDEKPAENFCQIAAQAATHPGTTDGGDSPVGNT